MVHPIFLEALSDQYWGRRESKETPKKKCKKCNLDLPHTKDTQDWCTGNVYKEELKNLHLKK